MEMVCQWCASPRNSVTSLQPGMMSWEFSRLIELSPIISRDTTTRSSTRKQLNIDPRYRVVCLCLCVWGSEVTNPTSPTIINWPWPSRKFANTQVAAPGSWWCWWSDQHQSQSCHWYIYIFLSPLLSHCNFSEAACATCVITGAERCYHGKISLRTINTQRTFNLLMILHYKISWDFWVMKGLKLI